MTADAPRNDAPARDFVRLIASAVLTVVFIYAVFVGGTHPGIADTNVRLLSGVIALVVIGGWLVVAVVNPAWRPRSAVLLPIALAFLVFCVAILVSQRPRLSQDALLQASGLVLAFLLLSRLAAHPFYRSRLIGVVVAVTVVIAVTYAIHVLVSWGVWWSSVGRLTAPPVRPVRETISLISPALAAILAQLNLGLVGLTSAILVLAMPFAVTVVAARSRLLAVVIAAIGLFALVASASRAGLVGAAVGFAAGLVLVLMSGSPVVDLGGWRRRTRSVYARVGGLLALAITFGLAIAFLPAVVGRFAGGIDEARLSIYGSTLRLIAAKPLLGNGPGTWSALHSAMNVEGSRNIVQSHAHSTYLQTLSDVGVIGAVVVGVAGVIVVIRLVQRFRAAEGSERLIIGGILVGLAGAAGQAISDHLINLPVYCLMLAALVAIGLEQPVSEDGASAAEAGEGNGGRAKRWAGVGVMAAIAVVALIVAPTIVAHARAESFAAEARSSADEGDWAGAERSARQAVLLDPGLALYRTELGLALAHLARPGARALIAGAAAEDSLPHLQLSSAVLALEDGDTAAALDAVSLAERRTSGEVIVDLNAGEVARVAGRDDLAVDWWASALSATPELAGSEFFSDPLRVELVRSAIAVADARLAGQGNLIQRALLGAYSGRPDVAERDLRAMPESVARDLGLAAVVRLDGRLREAIAILEAAAARDITAPGPHDALVRYCVEAGDEACARRHLPLAIILGGGGNASTPNGGSTVPAPADQRSRGVPGAYPADVYLQDGFEDMLAPEVIVIGLP